MEFHRNYAPLPPQEVDITPCPKCGWPVTRVRWIPQKTTVEIEPTAPTGFVTTRYHEYLNVTCQRCRHQWEQDCLDASNPYRPPDPAPVPPEQEDLEGQEIKIGDALFLLYQHRDGYRIRVRRYEPATKEHDRIKYGVQIIVRQQDLVRIPPLGRIPTHRVGPQEDTTPKEAV